MRTLMRRMAISVLYRKPNTSKKTPGRTIYPYLLRTLAITRANQVSAMDTSYIRMARGFVYLAAVINRYSRRVLDWRVSISMDTEFCIEAVEESITRYGTPEIFNADQGSQFTSAAFTGLLGDHGIRTSMDSKGCWRDNVFIARLWRSIKYEDVYLQAYESVSQAHSGIGCYIEFYNTRRRIGACRPAHLIWCTSNRCYGLWPRQPEPAGSTYKSSQSIQTKEPHLTSGGRGLQTFPILGFIRK